MDALDELIEGAHHKVRGPIGVIVEEAPWAAANPDARMPAAADGRTSLSTLSPTYATSPVR